MSSLRRSDVPSESIYIAGFAVLLAGLLCAVGGETSLGVAGALAGALLWALARCSREAEVRNYRAFHGRDPRHGQDTAEV